jgi:hypothetical protein
MQDSTGSDRRTRYPIIITYALIFLLCCLLSSGREVWDARKGGKESATNPALRADRRFAAIKAILPARGVVGYIGEPDAMAMGDYYAAQYALAPLVVEHSANHPLVVGNFPSATGVSDQSQGLQLVRDFGDGVLLFSNPTATNPTATSTTAANPAAIKGAD